MKTKVLVALGAVFAISGCAVKPVVLTTDELKAAVRIDVDHLSQQRDAVSAPISLDEAIARAVRNNRDRKLKVLESALAQRQLDLARFDALPSLAVSEVAPLV